MSVEATWDLRASASPRSLCVFAASDVKQSPFEVGSATESTNHAVAAVFGTEKGSLHYRTYAPINRVSRGGLSSSQQQLQQQHHLSSARSSSQQQPLQVPLGVAQSKSTRPSSQLPRSYYPVDLNHPLLPGSVVACISVQHHNHHHHSKQQQMNAHIFLLLVDDNRGASASQPGAFSAHLVALQQGTFHVLTSTSIASNTLPRMSCATCHSTAGLVYAAGRTLTSLPHNVWEQAVNEALSVSSSSIKRGGRAYTGRSSVKRSIFGKILLPAPVRSGPNGLVLTADGNVAVVAVGNSFYAVAGNDEEADHDAAAVNTSTVSNDSTVDASCVKIVSFTQSSQVHPVIVLDVPDESLDPDWSLLFLASGRECAAVDLYYGPPSTPRISSSKPRNAIVTVASPILAAASSWPWIAVLTSDGLISIRSPSCMAIPLRTVEVGNQPNDYFCLRTLQNETQASPWIVSVAYSGEAKVLQCHPDTAQDLADRLMRHSIDAFGANGFPRAELAEALHASFTATSYVGPEASAHSRTLLKQYLEAVLGLSDWESGGTSGWPTELAAGGGHHGTFLVAADQEKGSGFSGRGAPPTVVSAATPAALLTGSALLCLVCLQLSPPNSKLASRAAKACAEKMGVIVEDSESCGDISEAAIRVCDMVAEKMLREASSSFSLLSGSSPMPIVPRGSSAAMYVDFVEASIWLLRSCGKHEHAIDVAYERLQRGQGQVSEAAGSARGTWSQIKYESYTATHLSDLWAAGTEEGCSLVIRSPATHRLLENNPRLGLSVFTAMHPQSESQWRSMQAKDDPLAHPERAKQVVKLLNSINPATAFPGEHSISVDEPLPLESGRALAVSYLESAIGITTGRPTEEDEFDSLPTDEEHEERIVSFHDELSFLLLEGVISERRDDESDSDTELGKIYRDKLRRLLRWPLAKIRSDQFMNALPSSFLEEKALVLGRLGRHEDALRILYRDLQSLDLALQYCDNRHEQLKAQRERARARQYQSSIFQEERHFEPSKDEDNAYLPLVRVALDSEDTERGTAAAIQVLALRRSAIDRAAALRLLPSDVPVSAVARPFLIPALVDSESQVRRLTVVSALLRARYLRLKGELTSAQLKAQSNLYVVPQLRNLNLGDPLHSSNPFRARTSTSASSSTASNMPDVMIVKHFFLRHLVIQAKVTNSVGLSSKRYARTLSDIAFVVAESSEEAIQPLLQVPIQVLPPKMTGCAWCVLSAAPARMEGSTAQLTCELRYTVQSVEASSGLAAAPPGSGVGRTFVEELQDLEVHAAHFT